MATIEVTFTPLPAHVRTARLVAAAVARRSGVPEPLLDEVRLAVGEACSRAVQAHQAARLAEPVRMTLTSHPGRLEIEVINVGGPKRTAPEGLALAVISGLADDVRIEETPAGTSVTMSWPTEGATEGAEAPAKG
jgi:serine/threonine-protein kinase RsbW